MRRGWIGLGFGLLLLANAANAIDCRTPTPCVIDGGAYQASLPDGRPKGAILFLHGYGGSGEAEMRNQALLTRFNGRGYAVIAPSALPRRAQAPANWNVRLDPARRDDIAFLDAVASDAAARFGFPRDAVVAAGFSDGAMMVWRLACDAPDRFAAFAPTSGVMWRPIPDTCAGPVRLLHTHGWSDAIVPLEGRSLGGGALVQGDLFASLALLRAAAGCADDAPDALETRRHFLIRRWSDCAPGGDIVFAQHPGGHGIPEGLAGMVMDWFEAPDAPLALPDGEGRTADMGLAGGVQGEPLQP